MVTTGDLHGIHVALLTPFVDGALDVGALKRLVQRVLDGGIRGICPVGSTGEGPRLTRDLRCQVTAEVRSLASDAPLIAAASALTATEAIDEISRLETAGADAVLLAPPSYYPMAATEIGDYYRQAADASGIPLVIYNIPAMTKISVPPPVLATLATHPNIIGIKDSSRDLEYLQATVYATSDADFAVLTGTDTMLIASLTVGAVGAIAASANLVPALSRGIHDAYQAGNLTAAASAQRRLYDIVQACRAGGTPTGWKAALSLAGICEATMVPPAQPLSNAQRSTLADRLHELEVIPRISIPMPGSMPFR